MGVYNSLVVEYDVENLVEYLRTNNVEKDSCLSFDLAMLEKMEEAGIRTLKKEFCETWGLHDLREHLEYLYKNEFEEEWNRFYNINDFELNIDYLKVLDIKNFCLAKKEKGEEFEISHFLNFIEKNWKHLVDYDVIKDWYYPILSIKYLVW